MASDAPHVLVFVGGTSGLGFEALKQLIAGSDRVWQIILGSRSPPSASQYAEIQTLVQFRQVSVEHVACDLRSRHSVHVFAATLLNDVTGSIYALVLCSGITCISRRVSDGEEETLQVNALNQALLLQLLLTKLGRDTQPGRVIFVGSELHRIAAEKDKITPSNIDDALSAERWTSRVAYRASKLVQMHLYCLSQERLSTEAQGPIAIAVTPGFVPSTGLSREQPWFLRSILSFVIQRLPFATALADGAGIIHSAIVAESPQSQTYISKSGRDRAADQCYDKIIRNEWNSWLIRKGVWSSP